MMNIISFQEAIQNAKLNKRKIRLLLGNGFSISLFPKIFSYKTLFERANAQELFVKTTSAVPQIFTSIKTFDFEYVMQLLKHTSLVLPLYKKDERLIREINDDYEKLKEILIEAIATNHPDSPEDITDAQYENCKNFLINFEAIYTINYDLLLYWVILKFINEIKLNDGFHNPYNDLSADECMQKDYVSRSPGDAAPFRLNYIHGAMHLYDAQHETRKYCWSRTGIKLKAQILSALNDGMFPLFVSEGNKDSKLAKINHSEYLSKALKSLGSIGGNLFVFGMGFKGNDDHIMHEIVKSPISNLYVSLYGNAESLDNKELVANIEKMICQRNELIKKKNRRSKLEVVYYNAESANVWGKSEIKS